MDKNAIKKYAVWARRELIEKVTQKAQQFGVEDGKEMNPNAESVGGTLLTDVQKKQRQALIRKVNQDGFQQIMEEVAYTWFNRFIALRFMEVNGYLPSHVRVFTDDNNKFKPQILSDALHLDLQGLDQEKVYAMKSANQDEDLFKYLLIVQCNDLNSILPGMFQKIADYSELLLPDYLLRDGSVIEQMITMISQEDWDVSKGGQIEIIGWMYQYYISEKHEEVVDPLHGKVVKKEEVPAATQLFTTDWVVRYLVDNSVGRYWIERNPQSKLADELTYFVRPKDGIISTVAEKVTPQEITVLDPCIGSGHFVVYAFDVLMKIYEEYGFSEREAAAEIVKNNLFGLDIDGRATQLAYFAVMMKARQYDRRFLTRGIQPHIYEIIESNSIEKDSLDYFCGNDVSLRREVNALIDIFIDAKEYGSILQMPAVNFDHIHRRFDEIYQEGNMYDILLRSFDYLAKVAEVMSNRYSVVATNPPYLNKYDAKLKKYIMDNYADYKGDLFSVFMYRNFGFCKVNGYSAFMTPMVWMFIKTYEPIRKMLIESKHITTLIQFEYSAFEEATVPICSFVLSNNKRDKEKGYFFRLSDFKGGMDIQNKKILEAQKNKDCGYYYEVKETEFFRIPGAPITYWATQNVFDLFDGSTLKKYAITRIGLVPGNMEHYLRYWYEIGYNNIGFHMDRKKANDSTLKWFPYNKAGDYRKWYGNLYYVIDWQNDGYEMQHKRTPDGKRIWAHNFNLDHIFERHIGWNDITSSVVSFRYYEVGFLFDSSSNAAFINSDAELFSILGYLNTSIVRKLSGLLNPTIHFKPGDFNSLPYREIHNDQIVSLVKKCIQIEKEDWDSFETSWNYQTHPFCINLSASIQDSFGYWEKVCTERFCKIKSAEEELNKIYIHNYGLQNDLDAKEEEKDVTIRLADLQRDIRSFISYAVGCMFGRYSLDKVGLIYAGGDWNPDIYKTFIPDEDNIIPVCDDDYFNDDIVGRFVKFVEVVYGKDTLEENLRFIADALGGKGTPREVIRNYFLNDFYKDHCKTYQKRPIYWLFDSGKKNGFKCLIYMHRYQPDTIARIRTDYVHEQQSRYRTAIEETEQRLLSVDGSNRVKLNKKLKHLQEQDEEIHAYEENIHHLADQMISIDLDDGVKHNYAIFQDVLAKIK